MSFLPLFGLLGAIYGRIWTDMAGYQTDFGITFKTSMNKIVRSRRDCEHLDQLMDVRTDGHAISCEDASKKSYTHTLSRSMLVQMQAAKTPRVILEGGGDCDISEVNNRLSFMDSYQQHLFQKTALHIFGTANLDTFCEQN